MTYVIMMSLKKIYSLNEAEDDVSDGVPQTIPTAAGGARVGSTMKQGQLDRLFGGQSKPRLAGAGPTSDGVPTPIGGGDGMPQNPGFAAPGMDPLIGDPVALGATTKVDFGAKTVPNPRPNPGGTGGPPKAAGAFSRAPNAPEEPLPDLPLEGISIRGLFGLTETQSKAPIRGPARLAELYSIDEMPRPKGSFGGPAMAALKWAKERAGHEFTARDAFRVWRQAGGQPNQPDENKAYQSFQTTWRQFIDPNGRGTPEKPIVTTVAGVRGSRGQAAIYSWGAARPSKTAAAKPQPGKTPFDDMELGPAGSGGEHEPDEMDLTPDGEEQPPAAADQEPEAPEDEQEPAPEPEADPEVDDEYDWIPEADPETGVGRAMIALNEHDPEKLQQLLADVHGAETVMAAAQSAIKIYGRGSAIGSHAIKVAKSAAANLGLPDPDGVL